MNCIIVDDDNMIRQMLEFYISKVDFLELVASCTNATEASEAVIRHPIDLIFLDVEMPGMTGFDFLKTFGNSLPAVILITSDPAYAAEAFNYDVLDYLIKPIQYERFLAAINKAKTKVSQDNEAIEGQELFVKVHTKFKKLKVGDILWVEALGDYVKIHTEEDKYTVSSTMKELEDKLPPHLFMRIHNSFIVKLKEIAEIKDNKVMIGNEAIPVSRANKKKLMEHLKFL